MNMAKQANIIGFGSPVVDLVAEVSEEFVVSIPGSKGGMELVDAETILALLGRLDSPPVKSPGGSAGNTVFALSRMGMQCSFLGKLGDDDNGVYYRDAFRQWGGDDSRFKVLAAGATACCLSLVTPDHERTMRTNLGAALTLAPGEITGDDLAGFTHAHVEGYLLFNPDLLDAILTAADGQNVTVSLDLGSYEVVDAARDILPGILRDHVDIVFANEEEASHFTGRDDLREALDELSELCEVAAVKMGKDGSLLKQGDESISVPSLDVDTVLDTTGAGDYWAAGFLRGHLNGLPLVTCGMFGSLLGGTVVQHFGADLPESEWRRIMDKINATLE